VNTGFQLYQLQQIDTKIDTSLNRIDEIDRFNAGNTSIKNAQDQLSSSENKYIEEKNLFEHLNSEVQAKKNKKAQSESSLYGGTVKNPKELQDFQQEISSLTKIILKLEDELLEKLIELENFEEQMKAAKGNLKQSLSNYETQKSLLVAERSNKIKDIENLKTKKDSLIGNIDKSALENYQILRKSKNGIAVVEIQDDSCSGCGTSLTPNQRQKARSANELFSCPSCRRIVYGS
jgi:predicted  nucleic acid-binding Zn-ribbon protein